jgi:hypothetical protein
MRMFRALSLTALAAAAFTAAPAPAATSMSPVSVASCTVVPASPTVTVMKPGVDLTDGVLVSLVNNGTKTTQSITVTGTYHGRTMTDTVDAEIKPGKTTQIYKQYTPSVFVDIYAKCSVVKVTFADGTTWP